MSVRALGMPGGIRPNTPAACRSSGDIGGYLYALSMCQRLYNISLVSYLVWFPKQSFELDFIVRILWKAIDTD